MTTLYILCAILGGGLVAASLAGAFDHGAGFDGSADANANAGSNANHSGDHGVHGISWLALPIFSMQFWIFSVAAFGLIGSILSATGAGATGSRFAAAMFGGLTTGLLVWLVFRLTARVNKHEVASAQRFSGERATVTVAIRPNAPGKIRVQLQGQVVEVLASTDSGVELLAGSQVFVLGMSGVYADVVPYDSVMPGENT